MPLFCTPLPLSLSLSLRSFGGKETYSENAAGYQLNNASSVTPKLCPMIGSGAIDWANPARERNWDMHIVKTKSTSLTGENGVAGAASSSGFSSFSSKDWLFCCASGSIEDSVRFGSLELESDLRSAGSGVAMTCSWLYNLSKARNPLSFMQEIQKILINRCVLDEQGRRVETKAISSLLMMRSAQKIDILKSQHMIRIWSPRSMCAESFRNRKIKLQYQNSVTMWKSIAVERLRIKLQVYM